MADRPPPGRFEPRQAVTAMKRHVTSFHRRRFLQVGGLSTAAAALPRLGLAGTAPALSEDRTVRLSGDGVGLSPAQYTALLHRLADEKNIVPDSYSLGGIVEELETHCARVLGKERAIF